MEMEQDDNFTFPFCRLILCIAVARGTGTTQEVSPYLSRISCKVYALCPVSRERCCFIVLFDGVRLLYWVDECSRVVPTWTLLFSVRYPQSIPG